MTYSSNDPMGQPTEPTKFSPAKVLHKLMAEGRSGRLILTDPNDTSIQWCVYFGGGQIHFAGSLVGMRERMVYLLAQTMPGLETSIDLNGASDYQTIIQHWQVQRLPLHWVRQILGDLTQEALMQFTAVPQGYLKYESSIGLDPLLLSVPFRQIILPIRDAITQWTQLRAELASPLQRPYLLNEEQCHQLLWTDDQLRENFQTLTHLMNDRLTLYEIAHRLSRDVLELAIILKPLIEFGGVGVEPYQVIEVPQLPVVACVDDSPTIQQFVKLSLESSGYEVLSCLDPSQAIANLLHHKPIMIFMDIEMPGIDGYELCRSARQFEDLRQIPIVMLTGREGIIDRVRARMAGSTAYLTKPFNPQEMLNLVQKLTQAQPAVSV
jgi:twitching motility two-component system response regulator PilG